MIHVPYDLIREQQTPKPEGYALNPTLRWHHIGAAVSQLSTAASTRSNDLAPSPTRL